MSEKNELYMSMDTLFVAFCCSKGVEPIKHIVNEDDDDEYYLNSSNIKELRKEYYQLVNVQNINLFRICDSYINMLGKTARRKGLRGIV